MANASVEVTGPNAARLAAELQAVLAADAPPGDSVSPVEVERSADLIIAVIGLVFSGVGTAQTLWDWWQARRPDDTMIRVILDDGTRVEVSGSSGTQLEIEFAKRTQPGA